jgi:CDP-6-deoxy-D-xylo-4-hexulose-3-dehydrase
MSKTPESIKAEILRLTREFSKLAHVANRPGYVTGEEPPFNPGATTVPYAGRVFTEDEVEAAVGATLDFWLTLGKEGEAFEKELAEFLGVRHSLLVNSGSSANLIAVSALTSHKLPVKRRLLPGDEVITCAAGFPTTVAPILQNNLVPVFIDNDPVTGNARPGQLEAAYRPGKTKAVMFAHTLGNPFDLGAVLEFCHKHELWLIEDNCDALGCTYAMPEARARAAGVTERQIQHNLTPNTGLLTLWTGTWGDISTQSFYPPHHLTMGEGGAVSIIRQANLKTYAESFRDWGRDCWCPSGKDNTCCKRFDWKLGELPQGYDHKYIYSHLGYNVKPLDTQAAIGRVQLRKLPAFIEARKENWDYLRAGLSGLESVFEFCLPTHATGWIPPAERGNKPAGISASQDFSFSAFSWDATGCRTDCSWFGFMLLVRPDAPFSRTEFARFLEDKKIGNRMLFGGNLLRQPAFVQIRHERPEALRLIGDAGAAAESRKANSEASVSPLGSTYVGADRLMNESIFIGTYPGLSKAMMDYEIRVNHERREKHEKASWGFIAPVLAASVLYPASPFVCFVPFVVKNHLTI